MKKSQPLKKGARNKNAFYRLKGRFDRAAEIWHVYFSRFLTDFQ